MIISAPAVTNKIKRDLWVPPSADADLPDDYEEILDRRGKEVERLISTVTFADGRLGEISPLLYGTI
jgi:hypothetical protein